MSAKRHHSKIGSKSRSRSKSSNISERLISKDFKKCEGEPKYYVNISKIMGRYMVAKKDLSPGEVILSELPLVVGPCTGSKLQCLGCYKNVEGENGFVKCRGCGWPLCSHTCPGLKQRLGHTDVECSTLKDCNSSYFLNYEDVSRMRVHLQAIVPLRCLLLKRIDPKSYNLLLDMEHHNDIRQNIPEVWSANQENVVNRIIRDWRLTQFTENEIHTMCGVLEVNCFEIGQQGVNIRGLYPTAFLMAHDCVPNTNHTDENINYRLTVRASTHISPGYPITMSYAYTLQNTLKRREHLFDNKFFECFCERCSDPTEMGSYSGALICPKCKTGLVLCDNPLDQESSWSCNDVSKSCPGYTITSRSMKLLLNRISQEVEQIDCNDINAMELFLDKYRNVLHPTHYLCLAVKISLSQLYGKIEGHLIHELTDEILLRKQNICKEILTVFDIIEPGFTRIRGVTLYELHAPMMILLTRQLSEKSFSKAELKKKAERSCQVPCRSQSYFEL
nr:protein msta-like [Leptinotarsa decemlineata]